MFRDYIPLRYMTWFPDYRRLLFNCMFRGERGTYGFCRCWSRISFHALIWSSTWHSIYVWTAFFIIISIILVFCMFLRGQCNLSRWDNVISGIIGFHVAGKLGHVSYISISLPATSRATQLVNLWTWREKIQTKRVFFFIRIRSRKHVSKSYLRDKVAWILLLLYAKPA